MQDVRIEIEIKATEGGFDRCELRYRPRPRRRRRRFRCCRYWCCCCLQTIVGRSNGASARPPRPLRALVKEPSPTFSFLSDYLLIGKRTRKTSRKNYVVAFCNNRQPFDYCKVKGILPAGRRVSAYTEYTPPTPPKAGTKPPQPPSACSEGKKAGGGGRGVHSGGCTTYLPP